MIKIFPLFHESNNFFQRLVNHLRPLRIDEKDIKKLESSFEEIEKELKSHNVEEQPRVLFYQKTLNWYHLHYNRQTRQENRAKVIIIVVGFAVSLAFFIGTTYQMYKEERDYVIHNTIYPEYRNEQSFGYINLIREVNGLDPYSEEEYLDHIDFSYTMLEYYLADLPTSKRDTEVALFFFSISALMFFLGSFGALSKMKGVKKKGYAWIEETYKHNYFLKINETDFPEMTREIKKLCQFMGIDPKNLKCLFDPRKSSSPAIAEIIDPKNRQVIYLTLPRHVILLFNKSPEQFKSLIAHEFCHILQSDTRIWLHKFIPSNLLMPNKSTGTDSRESENDYEDVKNEFQDHQEPSAFNAEDNFVDSDFYLDHLPNMDIDIDADVDLDEIPFANFLLRPFFKEMAKSGQRKSRKKERFYSEYLADIGSIWTTKNFSLLELLAKSADDKKEGEEHPANFERIINLKYFFVNIYNKAN